MAADGEDGWAVKRERRFTLALGASPAQRLAWLEQMIALASVNLMFSGRIGDFYFFAYLGTVTIPRFIHRLAVEIRGRSRRGTGAA